MAWMVYPTKKPDEISFMAIIVLLPFHFDLLLPAFHQYEKR
jgi:hypothetical protein